MTLPRDMLDALASALGAPHGSVRPEDVRAVSGGCVSPAWRVTVAGGPIFVKTAPPGGPEGMLAAEATSLAAIQATSAIRVPGVLAVGDDWLALEWLEPGRGTGADWAQLGRRLATLHRVKGGSWGWPEDNFIGPLPQANGAVPRWSEFWLERRLVPQFEAAAARLGAAARQDFAALVRRLPDLLDDAADADGPSLLHGDLWSGNVHMTGGTAGGAAADQPGDADARGARAGDAGARGAPAGDADARGTPADDAGALIDPSSAFGHREVDLAMAALFGGFAPSFFTAYEADWPLADGAADRRPIYQLYYLLVHVNLFGGSYVPATEKVLAAAG